MDPSETHLGAVFGGKRFDLEWVFSRGLFKISSHRRRKGVIGSFSSQVLLQLVVGHRTLHSPQGLLTMSCTVLRICKWDARLGILYQSLLPTAKLG